MTARLERRVAWLALFAFVVAGITPAAGHLGAASTRANFDELCSVVARESGGQKTAPSPAKEHRGTSDCTFCRLHANAPVLPPSSATLAAPIAPAHTATGRLDLQIFYALLRKTSGLSRAPPLAFLI